MAESTDASNAAAMQGGTPMRTQVSAQVSVQVSAQVSAQACAQACLLLPTPSASFSVSVLEGPRVLAVRHLAGGALLLDQALSAYALTPLPKTGTCLGADPCLIWRSPTEFLLLTSQPAVADGVLQALAPGRHDLACALDLSAGSVVFELQGQGGADVLARLVEASAVPMQSGQATRSRFMDVAVVIFRQDPHSVKLLFDRGHCLYAAQWIEHASRAHQSEQTPHTS
jgi:sarcosine oxidase, subunit gamma